MQQYVIFKVLKEYFISKEEEDKEHKTTNTQHRRDEQGVSKGYVVPVLYDDYFICFQLLLSDKHVY